MKKDSSNRVILRGVIEHNFNYSYETVETTFYDNFVKITDKNGNVESIPIIASEYTLSKIDKEIKGRYAIIIGSLTAFTIKTDKQNTIQDAMILVEEICFNVKETDFDEDELNKQNSVYIEGTICSKPVVRKAYKHICYTLLKVERDYKIEYIPCNFYRKDTRRIRKLPIETKIRLEGRLESKNKLRLLSNKRVEVITVHEVRTLRFETIR